MGMSSEEHVYQLKKLRSYHNGSYGDSINYSIDTIRKYKELKADYFNRLKADMVAMLEEIRLQAEEDIENPYEADHDNILMLSEHNAFADCFEQYNDLIEDKIIALKGDPHD